MLKDCQLDSTGPVLKIDQGGIVQIFDITNLNNVSVITTLKSDRPYAGFGGKIKVLTLKILKSCNFLSFEFSFLI